MLRHTWMSSPEVNVRAPRRRNSFSASMRDRSCASSSMPPHRASAAAGVWKRSNTRSAAYRRRSNGARRFSAAWSRRTSVSLRA